MQLEEAKNEIIRLAANFGDTIVTGALALQLTTPHTAVLLTAAFGMIGYFRELASQRTAEFLSQFEENKDKIIPEITNTDQFQSVFLKLMSEHITESNETKRQMMRNYALNIACGVNKDFNEHSKLISTLQSISLKEIDLLKLWWPKDGAVYKWHMSTKANAPVPVTIGDIQSIVRSTKWETNLSWEDHDLDRHNQLLLSLGYKGLLYVLSTNNFGSGQEVKVRSMTDFGFAFMGFVTKKNKSV